MTSNPIKISLTKSTNAKPWRTKHLISMDNNALQIHLNPEQAYFLREVQRAGRLCDQMGLEQVSLSSDWSLAAQWAFYQGFIKAKAPGHIHFEGLSPQAEQTLHHRIKVTEWVKHLVNLGPSECTPLFLTEAAEQFIRSVAHEHYHVTADYLIGEELLAHGYVGCYNVGRGSENPPVMLSLKVYPKAQQKNAIQAVLVGKGITFDSGGYVIKPRESIYYMKADMAGAATTTASLALAMLEGLNAPVELILCCAENAVSGSAYKPGDILEYKNGVKVEIINTDAEGRVVLADGLLRADATEAPLIIDAATLTGAAQIAVGKDFCALMSMDEELRKRALHYAEESGENLWPLPLEFWHQDMIPSLVTDTANALTTASPAGASTAAGFLSRFLKHPEHGWLHFDLANAYMPEPSSLWSGGATAAMVNTIAKTLLEETKKK